MCALEHSVLPFRAVDRSTSLCVQRDPLAATACDVRDTIPRPRKSVDTDRSVYVSPKSEVGKKSHLLCCLHDASSLIM